MHLAFFILAIASTLSGQGEPPLLSFQAMQDLRDGLSAKIVEVEVVQRPQPEADQSFGITISGQAVCLRDSSGQLHVVTSQMLVQDATRVRIRSKGSADWVVAEVESVNSAAAIALLARIGDAPFRCTETRLARVSDLNVGGPVPAPVFSVDNPVDLPNIFWGYVAKNAEPPSDEYLLTTTGLPVGYPLFTAEGELAALNLRRYTPTSDKFLAVSCDQLRRLFWYRDAMPPQDRVNRRDSDQP